MSKTYSQGQQIVDNLEIVNSKSVGEAPLYYACIFVSGETPGEKESRHALLQGGLSDGEVLRVVFSSRRVRDLAGEVNARLVKAIRGEASGTTTQESAGAAQ